MRSLPQLCNALGVGEELFLGGEPHHAAPGHDDLEALATDDAPLCSATPNCTNSQA